MPRPRSHPMRRAAWLTLLVLALIACGDPPLPGVYRTVSESESNLELTLREDGTALLAGVDAELRRGTWEARPPRVSVRFDGRAELLLYQPELSFRDFGCPGSGPGLRAVGAKDDGLLSGAVLWRAEALAAVPDPC